MKKSTLITTIAMIVVVVVALSTATYAWFSSSATVTATATIVATSDGTFQIREMTIGSATPGQYGDTMTLSKFDTMDGLYSPKATLTQKTAGLNTATVTLATAETYNKYFVAKGAAGNYTIATAETNWEPDVFQVYNQKTSAQNLVLSLNLRTADMTDASNYAVDAFRFVIFATDGTNIYTITNGYNYGAATAESTEVNNYNNETACKMALSTVVTGTQAISNGVVAQTIETTDNGSTVAMKAPTYNTANSKVSLASGVAANGFSYQITFPQIVAQTTMAFEAYFWIDGWTANSEAGNGTFTCTLNFSTSAVDLSLAA